MKQLRPNGFTIIELMISTSIFSVVLLALSAASIFIGRSYYKGLNESHLSATTTSVMNDIAQGIEFSGANVDGTDLHNDGIPGVHGFCIGNRMYTYRRGQAVSSSLNGLVSYDAPACSGATPLGPTNAMADASLNPRELLSNGMAVTNIAIEKTGTLYKITLQITNSPQDLLCYDGGPADADCSNAGSITSTTLYNYDGTDLKCKPRADAHFCSFSKLTTTVIRRVGGGN